jgi:hypothetical protein
MWKLNSTEAVTLRRRNKQLTSNTQNKAICITIMMMMMIIIMIIIRRKIKILLSTHVNSKRGTFEILMPI